MIETLKKYLSCPIFVCGSLFSASVIALGAALIAEHFFNLKPCPLCIYQRIPFAVTAILAMIGLILSYSPDRMKIVAGIIFTTALFYLGNSIIAGYHSGVERHWWVSFLQGCTVDFSNTDNLLATIEQTTAARCDEIPWADPILGLSMANYNIPFSLGLSAFAFISSILMVRRSNGF